MVSELPPVHPVPESPPVKRIPKSEAKAAAPASKLASEYISDDKPAFAPKAPVSKSKHPGIVKGTGRVVKLTIPQVLSVSPQSVLIYKS